MLEISCGEFANDKLIESNAQFGLFPDSEFIYTELYLANGDINNLTSTDKRQVFGQTIEIKSKITEIISKLKLHNKIRIWTSTADTEDYLSMLFILSIMKIHTNNPEVYIVDTTNLPIDDKYPNTPAWNLSCIDADCIKELLKYEEILTSEKISKMVNNWDELVKINSSLRILENGIVKSVDEDCFDHIMLDILKKIGDVKRSELIGNTMAECMYAGGHLTDLFYAYRLDKLIEAGSIKVVRVEDIEYHSIVAIV